MSPITRKRRSNTSGYPGVSWSKAAGKWAAYIRVDGKRRYLGLFLTAEAADGVIQAVIQELPAPPPEPTLEERRAALLGRVRDLYDEHGIAALSTTFLERQKGRLYYRLLEAGLPLPTLLAELGLAEQFQTWRDMARSYRGKVQPKWSYEVAVARARKIMEREGSLPTVDWFRKNGLSSLPTAVFHAGRTWEDLRQAVDSFDTSNFSQSRNGMRWRSRPEASLSNFLYARRIEHRRGELYAQGYADQFERSYGRYDLHFLSTAGVWMDVEIWGDLPERAFGSRYAKTRAAKEAWHADATNFLGIHHLDCLSDETLTRLLEPYIGVIAPFVFDKPTDRFIETSHWSNADELLETCKQLAATMPDGVFPAEDWLRKRGKHADREGLSYNTLAIRLYQWLGGTRRVRELLGQGDASTTAWTKESVIEAWQQFQQAHGATPSQVRTPARQEALSADVLALASRIYQTARRLGVLDEARQGRDARHRRWTVETVTAAWHQFHEKHGRIPSQCMSARQRRRLPREVTDEATNIYGAANRLGILKLLRGASAVGLSDESQVTSISSTAISTDR